MNCWLWNTTHVKRSSLHSQLHPKPLTYVRRGEFFYGLGSVGGVGGVGGVGSVGSVGGVGRIFL